MNDDEREQHRGFGAALFNQTWDLIDKADRAVDDDVAMLLSAAASRWHWGQIGNDGQIATGDWQLAHVASLCGMGDLAMVFARRNLDTALACGWDGWRLASAHEGMARACTAAADTDGREDHLALAAAALERESDPEEREIVAGQLASIPAVRPAGGRP